MSSCDTVHDEKISYQNLKCDYQSNDCNSICLLIVLSCLLSKCLCDKSPDSISAWWWFLLLLVIEWLTHTILHLRLNKKLRIVVNIDSSFCVWEKKLDISFFCLYFWVIVRVDDKSWWVSSFNSRSFHNHIINVNKGDNSTHTPIDDWLINLEHLKYLPKTTSSQVLLRSQQIPQRLH